MTMSRRKFLQSTGLIGAGIAGSSFLSPSGNAPDRCKAAAVAAAGRKGIALAIGLNSVDPKHYAGWSGLLRACESDANDMVAIATSKGFACTKLLTKQATRNAVITAVQKATKTLRAGDIFMMSYSGHGGQIDDFNGDEADGKDETWCLYDGQMIDDELAELWTAFLPGVRILLLSDSCHSGTVAKATELETLWNSAPPKSVKFLEMQRRFRLFNRPTRTPDTESEPSPIRAMPADVAKATFERNRMFYRRIGQHVPSDKASRENTKATVLLISGCQDNQLSSDGEENGLFTGTLKRVWDGGKFTGNYRSFHLTIQRNMPLYQSPNYYLVGVPNPAFEGQSPFTI